MQKGAHSTQKVPQITYIVTLTGVGDFSWQEGRSVPGEFHKHGFVKVLFLISALESQIPPITSRLLHF